MRIAKFTLDGYLNYGNLLQNYALQEVLKRYAQEVHTIWHTPGLLMENMWKKNHKDIIKWIINHNGYRKDFYSGRLFLECARIEKGYEFAEKYLNIRYDVCHFAEIVDQYDFFVVGSDQVWNPLSNEKREIQFLTFAPEEKRIAYAVSMGTIALPVNDKTSFINGLKGMTHISVREREVARFIKNTTGQDAEVVCDPTLLIPREKWDQISSEPFWYSENDDNQYIIEYFLGGIPKEIDSVCERKGLKIVRLMDPDRMDYYFTSPQEWIFLIKHASMVLTDSFHGVCFSILYGKPFIVYNRTGKGTFGKMSSRIDELLEAFELKDKNITATYGTIITPISQKTDQMISEMRDNAFHFLDKAFSS